MSKFADLVGDISHGKLDELPEDEDNLDEAPAETPDTESLSEDKPDEDPADEDDSDAGDEPDESPESGEGEGADDEAEDTAESHGSEAEDEDKDEIVVIDGKEFTLDEVREWKQGAMRQDDYTRKTQQLSERSQEIEEAIKSQRKLAKEIANDKAMQKFLSAHPEALEVLLEDPKATRKLVGDPQAVDDFWADYEIIQENPRLAGRLNLSEGTDEEAEEVSEEVRVQRQNQAVTQIAAGLKYAVGEVAKEFDGVDEEEVENYILELGGIPASDPTAVDRDTVVSGMYRLFNMMYVTGPDGELQIDGTLIRDRFEHLADKSSRQEARDEEEVEQHNKKVDEALKDEDGAPPASPGGEAPAPTRETPEKFENFRGAVDSILTG